MREAQLLVKVNGRRSLRVRFKIKAARAEPPGMVNRELQ
jgi:hypothetical protein